MGDFYRGDPGIGSFFGGLVKKAVGFIPGIGPVASAALDAVMPGGAKAAGSMIKRPAAGAVTAAAQSAIGAVKGVVSKHPVLSAAGAAGVAGATMGGVVGRMSAPKMKVNAQGQLVRHHRRMNSCNPRALRRAVRRLHSFARHYRKTVGFVSPHPKKGRMYFKRRKK